MPTTTKAQALQTLVESAHSRRQFAKRVMAGGLAAAAVASFGSYGGATDLLAAGVTDTDILNFALNLEYLEAEFYTVGTTGKRIKEVGIGVTGRSREGDTVGGSKVSFDEPVMTIMEQITKDEQAHVKLLRQALGGSAVAKPAINLEALKTGFDSQDEFLTVATIFEDVGVSAYGGAAPLIDNSKILGVAARIALTEAQHSGVLRYLAGQKKLTIPQVDKASVPVLNQPNGQEFFVDKNGLTVVRTPAQVLAIVYAGGLDGGGFFPHGVNGIIEQSR